jgi:hypothetical protein
MAIPNDENLTLQVTRHNNGRLTLGAGGVTAAATAIANNEVLPPNSQALSRALAHLQPGHVQACSPVEPLMSDWQLANPQQSAGLARTTNSYGNVVIESSAPIAIKTTREDGTRGEMQINLIGGQTRIGGRLTDRITSISIPGAGGTYHNIELHPPVTVTGNTLTPEKQTEILAAARDEMNRLIGERRPNPAAGTRRASTAPQQISSASSDTPSQVTLPIVSGTSSVPTTLTVEGFTIDPTTRRVENIVLVNPTNNSTYTIMSGNPVILTEAQKQTLDTTADALRNLPPTATESQRQAAMQAFTQALAPLTQRIQQQQPAPVAVPCVVGPGGSVGPAQSTGGVAAASQGRSTWLPFAGDQTRHPGASR